MSEREREDPLPVRSRWLAGALVVLFVAWAVVVLWTDCAKYWHKHHLLQHSLNKFPAVDAANHTVSSSSLTAGPYTLIVFVSPTCPHCLAELNSLAAIQSQFQNRLNIVVLSPSGDHEIAYLRSQFPSLPIYQISRSVFEETGLSGFPEVLFLHNGIVSGLQQGERSPGEQVDALNRFIGEAR